MRTVWRAEDVFPLSAMVESGHMWALGEPTHGSSNVAALRWDLIREVAQRNGVRILFEESASIARDINDALHGHGSLIEALAPAKPIWRTVTHLDGLTTLRDLIHEDRVGGLVEFVGIDVQHPQHAARRLLDTTGDVVFQLLADAPRPGAVDRVNLTHLTEACQSLVAAGDDLTAVAHQLLGWGATYGPDGDHGRRDRLMAEAVLRHGLTDRPALVWAHNEHVAVNEDFFGGPSMGHYLRAALGERYRAVGLLCGGGACRAVDGRNPADGYGTVPLTEPRPHTSEAALAHRTGQYLAGGPLEHPGPRRFLGWCVDPEQLAEHPEADEYARPLSDFDGVIHIGPSMPDQPILGL